MPTQIALDKADPAVNDIISMLSEGESVTFKVTGVPGPMEDPVVMLEVTDIEIEDEGMETEDEQEAPSGPNIMPETQLKDSGFDTGPVAPKKKPK